MEEGANIAKELYLSILVDRDTGWATFIASTEGGMEIEEVAEKSPEKIIKEAVDPAVGFQATMVGMLRLRLGCNTSNRQSSTPLSSCWGIFTVSLWRRMRHW